MRAARSFFSVLLAVLLAGSACSTARAEPPDGTADATLDEIELDRPLSRPPAKPEPDSQVVAAELYNSATAEWKQGRIREAFRLFRASYEMDGSPEALANLAVIEAQIGRPRLAAEHLAAVLERLPPEHANKADDLKRRLAELAKQVGVLRVRIEAEGDVYLDGKWISSAPVTRAVYVDPGAHAVRVQVEAALIERSVEVRKGEEREVAVTRPEVEARLAQRRAEAAALAAAAAPPPRPPAPVVGIGLGVTAALAVLGGVGLGVQLRAAGEKAKIEEDVNRFGGACPASSPGFADDCRARDQEAANEGVGTVLAGAGFGLAAAAGLGTLLYVTIPTRAPAAGPAARLRLVPAVGGALLQGTF